MNNRVLLPLILLLLFSSSAIAMTCSVNGEQIPCSIWWASYGWFIAVPFTLIGLLLLLKTDWFIEAQVWQQKLLGSKWVPGKKVPLLFRAMGIFFLVFGLFCLYFTLTNL